MLALSDSLVAASETDPTQVPPGGEVHLRDGVAFSTHPLPLAQLNRAWLTGEPVADWPARVAEVAAAHRGVRSRWEVHGEDPARDGLLAQAGYRPFYRLDLLTTQDWRLPGHGSGETRLVGSAAEARTWVEIFHRSRDLPVPAGAAAPYSAGPHHFYVTWVDGRAVGAGAMRLDTARRLGMLWGSGSLPDAREKGVYRSLLRARLRDARALGLALLYTHARPEATLAPMVRAGFEVVGRAVIHWERPADTR